MKRGKGNKKGQLTIFIIIAIVIVAAIVAVIIIQRTQEGPAAETRVIKNYLDSCFKEKAEQTILELARRGFYYELPEDKISFLGEETAYYFKDNQNLMPSVTEIEQELAKRMDRNMLSCLTLHEFREEYDISFDECSTSASVKDEGVEFPISCPITVSKGITTSTLDNFQANVDCNVQKIINTAEFVVAQYIEDLDKEANYLCLTCLGNIAETNNVEITVVPITKEVFEPEHAWFIIKDKEKQINDQNLILRFVTE